MRVLWALLTLWLMGCSNTIDTTPPTRSPVVQLDCSSIQSEAITCVDIAEGEVVVQTGEQTTITLWDSRITFDSTLYITSPAAATFTVAALDGTAVVGSAGMSRILSPGAQLTVSGGETPGLPEPYTVNALVPVALAQLDRPVSLPQSINALESSDTDPCHRPANWLTTYTIQRGDTLSRIATLYEVSVAELQEYNCIANPNRIQPGVVLYVPSTSQEANGEPAPVFYADITQLESGACTMLHWDAPEARVVYLQNEAVARSSSREICPESSITYTLTVVNQEGGQAAYTVTVLVVSLGEF